MAENHILARMSRKEVMICEEQADWFRSCLTQLATHERADVFANPPAKAENDNDDDFWPSADDWRAALRPYNVINGVLRIPVFGVLLNRFPYQLGRYATGYDYMRRALRRGLDDGNVRGIAFIHDSPGGEVAGNFELADEIFAARGVKPMQSFSSESMYSASYSLGSAAGPISMTRTAGVGSIGVVTAHIDYSALLEKEGIKITFIHAGKFKVDGNPYQPLSDGALKRIQARIDRLYTIFCQSVARNRDMDEDDVRDTEAATYTAEEAIEVGLADRVGIFDDEIAAWTRSLDPDAEQAEHEPEKVTMSRFTQEQLDQAVAEARREEQAKTAAAVDTAKTAAQREAATAAAARISTIMGSDAAKTRPIAARNCALKTDMTAEQAANFLADMPEEGQAKAPETDDTAKGKKNEGNANAFQQHMAKNAPDVGAGDSKSGGGEGGNGNEKAEGNPLTKAYAAAGGMKTKAKAA